MSDDLISRQAAIDFIKNHSYPVRYDGNSIEKDYAVGFYNDNYGVLQVGTGVITIGDNEYYTHWRILPQPPKEESR